ncbi:hypothetical protein B9479_004238 [Cryptococcus floricola]|uniref:RING-type domain-containing protein n=1 Tax=Cryptococcus floricola TaxID=2591691 RepID=A0A5D3AYC6_9TREE|nr:hypothetical protein B9479_004238 [Cryptococcus floricola]
MSSRLPPPSSHIPFGNTNSTPSSKQSTSRQEKHDGGELEWLDYAECALCHDALTEGALRGRHFWMTSCGHILCSAEEHDHQAGICTFCNKKMENFLIQQGSLPPEHEMWFQNGISLLSNAIDDMKRSMKNSATAQRVVGFQYREMKRSILHYKTVLKEKEERIGVIEREQEALLSENYELHERLAKAQSEIHTLQRSQSQHPSQITPQSNPQHYTVSDQSQIQPEMHRYSPQDAFHGPHSMAPLPTVQEEDFGPIAGVSWNAGEDGYHKKRRVDSLDQQPRRFVPPTPTSGSSDIHLNSHFAQHLQPHHTASARPPSRSFVPPAPMRPTPMLAAANRPQSTMDMRPTQGNLGGDTRQKLDAYRYDSTNPSPPRRMNPPERPSTALPSLSSASSGLGMRQPTSFVERLKQSNSSFLQRPASTRPTPLSHQNLNLDGMDAGDKPSIARMRSEVPQARPMSAIMGRQAGQTRRSGNRF